jgi:hypothetical protein
MIGRIVTYQSIECKITDVDEHSNIYSGPVVWLEAVKGEPFNRYGFYGPCKVNWCLVPLDVVISLLRKENKNGK